MGTARFADKIALVTGAGSGIGRATAWLLAEEGARVIACGRRRAPLDALVADGKADALALEARAADVSDPGEVEALVAGVCRDHGRLDVLVNNAFAMVAGPIATTTPEQWRANFATTLDGCFYMLHAALPRMAEVGGGAIVQVGSTAGLAGQPGLAGYGSAKAALENLTRTAALEGAARGVRVNSVAPGVIATEGTLAAFAEPARRRAMEATLPLGRFGHAREIAEAIAFLASDAASYVTGTCLVVDGGQRAGLGAAPLDDDFERT